MVTGNKTKQQMNKSINVIMFSQKIPFIKNMNFDRLNIAALLLEKLDEWMGKQFEYIKQKQPWNTPYSFKMFNNVGKKNCIRFKVYTCTYRAYTST